jgi:hypothetical protein
MEEMSEINNIRDEALPLLLCKKADIDAMIKAKMRELLLFTES